MESRRGRILTVRRLAPAGTVLCAWLAAAGAAGQTGFAPPAAERQRALEAAVVARIHADSIAAMSRALSTRPHVAGSPGQAAVRDSLVTWLSRWGLEVEVAEYAAFLPWPRRVSLALVAPDTADYVLTEPPVVGDPATSHAQYPWVNGYSGTGVAEAEVVYAHYGLHDDYERLDELGIDVVDKVVVARYGHAFRGVKARLAQERGAAALLLYSDPADDGYVRGDVYPVGPYRPWDGVQRGSVMNGAGDPTTPDGPSVAGAPRVDPAGGALPSIPVLPVSYRVAAEILSRVGGRDLPRHEWQGALPFRYHVGPGPARVRVAVDDDRDGPAGGIKPIHDVIARVGGAEFPDEWVVVGAHIDAWGAGADDNVSGTASVLAAARAIAAEATAGRPPRRTILFAGWDAEEWGLIGSTEWVEEHAAELTGGAAGYVNQDAIGGTRFGAAAAPSLKPLVREAARAVPAGAGRSLYDEWAAGSEPPDAPPRIGDLGGGSDFAGFYNHLGIPSIGHGFGASGGVYHSAYDTWRWMTEFGDPGFENHARSSRLAAVLVLRLANAEVLPYDPGTLARELGDHWDRQAEEAEEAGFRRPGLDPLAAALARLAQAGRDLESAREAYLAGSVEPARSRRANAELRASERALTRPEGLVGRPWYRNLTFAADGRNGYATLALPSIAEAIRSGDADRIRAEVEDLAGRVVEAAERVESAVAALAR